MRISDWSSDVCSSDLLSSKSSDFWDGTNAQNIRGTFRDFLVADPECMLLAVDFSQSDDVFVGYESNDAHKIEVIESGMDGHANHGELCFARPYAWIVSGKDRKSAVEGRRVSDSVRLGGGGSIKKKKSKYGV